MVLVPVGLGSVEETVYLEVVFVGLEILEGTIIKWVSTAVAEGRAVETEVGQMVEVVVVEEMGVTQKRFCNAPRTNEKDACLGLESVIPKGGRMFYRTCNASEMNAHMQVL